jgi:hypothetical protein
MRRVVATGVGVKVERAKLVRVSLNGRFLRLLIAAGIARCNFLAPKMSR